MVSKSPTPPMIEDLIWRDRTWDNEVSRYRNMLEFYIDYESRPAHLKDGDENWADIIDDTED